MTIGTLRALNETWLKATPRPAVSLPGELKYACPKGAEIEIKWIEDDTESGHKKVDLVTPIYGKFSWFTYIEHWEAEEILHPKLSEFEVPAFKGSQVQLPGLGRRFLDQPVDGCKNFTWNELTHSGTRIPNSNDIAPGLTPGMVVQNIIKITKRLEEIREDFGGRPITINSAYRNPQTNKAVGGASQSRHLQGDAIDFNIRGVHPREIYQRYDATWIGGLAWSNGFVHIDARPGYKSRWKYPN